MAVQATALDEFVQEIAMRLKAEKHRGDTAAGRNGETSRVIQTQAPQWWAELRDWVKRFCVRTNRELGEQMFLFEVTPKWQFRVGTKAITGRKRTLEAHFNQELPRIAYSVGARTGEFMPRCTGAKIEFTEGGAPISVEGAGKTLIEALLGEE